jgi:gamma-glutamylcyclotransferase (GGCT)/AIG2-like uncharacterized protein YtfP
MATTAAAAAPTPAAPPRRPTTYYFAYGSNLHLKQMKRRCPNSKYVGRARLADYRWQINQRGYANVAAAHGHWVDGLVYEIDGPDEARLDVNEGVSKNAYAKLYLPVLLHRAPSALYRRPVAWITDKGGPAKVCRLAKPPAGAGAGKASGMGGSGRDWHQDVLVYVSLNHTEDSIPKDEYVSRINLGIADALALGIEDDYIRNCIRPFIPETTLKGPSGAAKASKEASPSRPKSRAAQRSPARNSQPPPGPDKQTLQPPQDERRNSAPDLNIEPQGDPEETPPPLPPRPAPRFSDYPYIVVERLGLFSTR